MAENTIADDASSPAPAAQDLPVDAEVTAGPPSGTEEQPLRRNRPFVLLQTGKTAQLVGASVGAFALPLIAYQVTGSVAQAGLITGVGEVGGLLATLPAGVVVDRMNRRLVLLVSTLVGAAVWGAVVVAAVSGTLAGWHLAGALFVAGAVSALASSAGNAAVRAVVTPGQMPQAMALTQARQAAAVLVAGPVGGFLFGLAHFLPFALSVVGHLVESVCTWFVRAPLDGDLDRARATHPVAALREGLRFVWSRPLFRLTLALFPLINIAFNGLLVAINLQLVQTGTPPLLIGMLDLVAGATMLVGSVIAAPLLKRFRVGPLAIAGLTVMVVAAAGMALLETYPAYLALLAVATLTVPAVNAGFAGYVSAITPTEMQGRVSSVLSLSGLLSAPVAPVVGSVLLATAGIGVALGSLAALLAVTVAGLACFPPLWRIGRPETWADDAIAWPPAAG